MAKREVIVKRGTTFEVTKYEPVGEKAYYRVGVEDKASPVGVSTYIDHFPTKRAALGFVGRQAAGFYWLGR